MMARQLRRWLGRLKRRFRNRVLGWTGALSHLRPRIQIESRWYGTDYGGFYLHPAPLGPASVVYSFGVGHDASFDTELIRRHGCPVYAFDPAPWVADWVRNAGLPDTFRFSPIGLGPRDESRAFMAPRNPENVSGSFVAQSRVDSSRSTPAEMRSLASIREDLGHDHVDVLKMDIEGLEYEVLDSILQDGVRVDQILVEFHERLFEDGAGRTRPAIESLRRAGYEVFAHSESLDEVSFIHLDRCGSNASG